jgi:hypothetical protein
MEEKENLENIGKRNRSIVHAHQLYDVGEKIGRGGIGNTNDVGGGLLSCLSLSSSTNASFAVDC